MLRDRDASRDELRRRDRRIGRTIAATADPADRRRTLRDWIRELRREDKGDAAAGGRGSAGERIVLAYHALGWLLTVLGLFAGAGSAAAVLAYDGHHPVNVVHFLAVFVALQILLVTLFLFSATLWRLRDKLPLIGGVYGLL